MGGLGGKASGASAIISAVGALQKGHFDGISPATRLIFLPHWAHITGPPVSISAGLKHIFIPLYLWIG